MNDALPKDNFSHSATVLNVKNINRSVEFYVDKLGFDLVYSWGNPIDYVVLKKGGVNIHLTSDPGRNTNPNDNRTMYIFVYNIYDIYDQCIKNSVEVVNPPFVKEYKMNDFDIFDLDGHKITFGNGQ